MAGIYLEPESTFAVSLVQIGKADFEVKDGGPIVLTTATGRQYAKLLSIFRSEQADAQYDALGWFVSAGLEKKDIDRLHPNAVAVLLFEVTRRSHLAENDAGN